MIEEYTSGDDIQLDQHLVAVDIYGSLAHAKMLEKQAIIHKDDLKNIQSALLILLEQNNNGQLTLHFGDEDVHTRIENDLTEKFPDSGAKLHTGRSRNDQVLVDIRLYTKIQLIDTILEILEVAQCFYKQACTLSKIPLPGMTHMQPAMLSSFGLWLGSFCESLLDDCMVIESAYDLNNQSPLGSGAAYGVTLPLDREYTAKLLGFAKVQSNALYCQNSRGKIEALVLHALSQVMATLNKFATDSLIFTSEPFSFINFDPSLGSGSSIMPQKQNWDALELMRAKYHQIIAAQLQLSSSLANLPSGYNRDLQQTKGSLITAFKTTISSLQVAQLHIQSIKPNRKQIEQHIPKELFAAHWAYALVQDKNLPFRAAYAYVKEHLDEIPDYDISKLLELAVSQGSTGNLQLLALGKKIKQEKQKWLSKQALFQETIDTLVQP